MDHVTQIPIKEFTYDGISILALDELYDELKYGILYISLDIIGERETKRFMLKEKITDRYNKLFGFESNCGKYVAYIYKR